MFGQARTSHGSAAEVPPSLPWMGYWALAILLLTSAFTMADALPELEVGDVGAYAEIIARPNPHGYAVVPIPSLVSTLLAAERKKGSPLTEAEVLRIRDLAGVLVVPDDGGKLEQDRGYKDIDPADCWRAWQAARLDLEHVEK